MTTKSTPEPVRTALPPTVATLPACSDPNCAESGATAMTCKLTTPALRQRKETVIASLKRQMVSRKELPDGYAYEFKGTDTMVDELAEFVKTERQCCDFFSFALRFGRDGGVAWLELTGPEGAKEFITQELEM